jgi:hypothetical protein
MEATARMEVTETRAEVTEEFLPQMNGENGEPYFKGTPLI